MRSTARAIRRMSFARLSVLAVVALTLVTAVFLFVMGPGFAMPGSPVDQTKVPHYFGPNTNWALSPVTTTDAVVQITGNGQNAAATAQVDAAGVITGITVTNPGNGYTTAGVNITGSGTGAAATPVISTTTTVTAVNVGAGGSGYTKPVVAITGGGATTDATASAYGGVDAIQVTNAGSGYKFPTVDFDMPDDPAGSQPTAHVVCTGGTPCPADGTGVIESVVVDTPGSGYLTAPNVVIRDGTLMDPVPQGGTGATAKATLTVQSVVLDTFGAGYTSAPTVAITDATGTGTGATATAVTDGGAITQINVTNGGSGYITKGGIRKFVDQLPGLCTPGVDCPNYVTSPGAKYIPLAVPQERLYNGVNADQYEIGLVQYRTKFSSDLPATLVRGYVQLETPANAGISQHYPLVNEMLDGTTQPVMINGVQALGVTPPQWLGPVIGATKNKPVRIVFRNLLPTGAGGNLFLPVDSTLMGSGMGPMAMPMDPVDQKTVMDAVRNPICTDNPQALMDPNDVMSRICFSQNRATLHLHGGITPWISDGTAHQWITPAGEETMWPQGVSVKAVPDMEAEFDSSATDGVETFYYTNQQSARLLFYHDHAWGITRLNVYAGEAAGYLITDDTEKALINTGTIPGAADTIPLVVQDRTFVPQDTQLYNQYDANGNVTSYGLDPTWDATKWGGYGNFWYHHVYMTAQNPGDPSGMSAYGRWMYGPWFWPPAGNAVHGPIANPYYNKDPKGPDGLAGTPDDWTSDLAKPCSLDDPATWQYQTDPFCEPKEIPGTPNVSVGMEQFNDTPIVNGVAYPTVTLQPKTYRLRMLNAANDRFFNFQWYVADPTQVSNGINAAGQPIGGTEVALNPQQLAAAQTDPVVFPEAVKSVTVNGTPVDVQGPDWVQIGTEGGFLPAPVVVDGQQVTTWITDPTRFDVGNVDKHSLLLAPAERADVIVDFSKFAGKTLILYNDAPAAFPARVPSYDYYTGQPDLWPNGAPGVLPGYGPNTRTIMQVKIAANPASPAFSVTKLRSAFTHKANGSGVFESSQHPIIVGQSDYNSAYGTNFAASSNCNTVGSALQVCDGLVRVNDTSSFSFNSLKSPRTNKLTLPLQPKAIHDEMNATNFDEFGRMQANLGIEAQPPQPGAQNVTLYPFVNPATEIIDGTNLPKQSIAVDANGNPVSDIKFLPISTNDDGTQIWRVTHNGVDTHPIHFHLYDVQIVNRVTWDNIIIKADPEELGWKDTVRMAPLEDTIVALRPVVPQVPWELPNAVRPLSPMEPIGKQSPMFNNTDPQGNPALIPITNELVNFGWEYVYHCHILSHEEMDMMRPVTLALPPNKADGLDLDPATKTLTWNDNSINETSFLVQRSDDDGASWVDVGTISSPLDAPNIHEVRTMVDPDYVPGTTPSKWYRVVAKNAVGYGVNDPQFPSMTVQSVSAPYIDGRGTAPTAPTGLTATVVNSVRLDWTDTSANETAFVIQRADNANPTFVEIARVGANVQTYTDTTDQAGDLYRYRVQAINEIGTPPNQIVLSSPWSNEASVTLAPPAPTGLTATLAGFPTFAGPQITLNWSETSAQLSSFVVEVSTDAGLTWAPLASPPSTARSYVHSGLTPAVSYLYRVAAVNVGGQSPYSGTAGASVPALPGAPSNVTVNATINTARRGVTTDRLTINWTDNASNEDGYQVWVSTDPTFATRTSQTLGANTTQAIFNVARKADYYVQVRSFNLAGTLGWVQAAPWPVKAP